MSAPQNKVAEALERNKKLAEQAAAVASGDIAAPIVPEINNEDTTAGGKVPAPSVVPTPSIPEGEDNYIPVVGSFECLVDKKIFGENGAALAVDAHGYYHPKSQEEYNILMHYSTLPRPFVREVTEVTEVK